MPVITVPEIVWLSPLRLADVPPWTRQPDGEELLVEDLMEPSEDAEASVSLAVREMTELQNSAPRIDARALRPYQEECIAAVFAAWKSGKKAPLIVMGTGSGKTVCAAEIIRRLRAEHPGFDYRVWFLAHREELLDQTYRLVKLMAPEATCGIVQGSRNDVGKFITIGSVDTLAGRRRFDEATTGHNPNVQSIVARPPSVVIVDEAHHGTSPKYRRLIDWVREANPNALFLGMTATPGRTDGTALDAVFDGVAYERNAFQLIADGYLVPPVGFRVNLNIDLDVIPTESGEFKKAPLSKVMNQPAVNQAVVEGYQRYGDGRKLLAFCVDVQHAKDLAEQFRQMGIQARHVDGTMKKADRDAVKQAFTEGKIRILTSCDVITEGYDDPSAQGVLFARPTNSQLVYIQCLDTETEILTRRGWMGADGVRDDDIVATMSTETGRCVWSPILSRTDRPLHPDERMFAATTPFVDFRVTGHHRMLYQQRRRWIWSVASQMPTCFKLPVTAAPESLVDCLDVSDADLQFLGWWYAEGTLGKTNRQITLYQRAESPFVADIEACLKACGLKFGLSTATYDTQFKTNHTMNRWTVSFGAPRGRDADKRGWSYLVDWIDQTNGKKTTPAFWRLSQRQLLVFLEAFNKGDGSKFKSPSIDYTPRSWRIYQKPGSGFHDELQALCVTRGINCMLCLHDQTGERAYISIKPHKSVACVNGTKPQMGVRQVDHVPGERVWCVETVTGTIVTRRGGRTAILGNCLGRALRLHPSKRDALVIDAVGNSQKHQLVQLASLAGLAEITLGDGKGKPIVEVEIVDAAVGGIDAQRIDFRVLRQRASKWSWRETRFGWTVSIPRIGYFLLAWTSNDRRTADVKFHDMRDGKRDSPPMVLSTSMDFEMAYGLVEQEIERLFSARTSRARIKDKEEGELGAARDVLEEGVSGELFSPEELMRNDADWRNKPTSDRQRAALVDIGVKSESVPATAGEASDLFSVMTIERNAKRREPATPKQKAMVTQLKLATRDEAEVMTKAQAQGLIVRFLKEKEAKKKALTSAEVPADDGAPELTDDDAPS